MQLKTIAIFLILIFLAKVCCASQSSDVQNILSWNFPLPRTHTGIPLANGKQGLLIWGKDNQLNITIARAGFWDRRGRKYYNILTNYTTVKNLLAAKDEPGLLQAFGIPLSGEDKSKRPKQIGGGRIEITFPKNYILQNGELDVFTGTISVKIKKDENAPQTIIIKQSVFDEVAWIDFPFALKNQVSVKLIPSWQFVGDILVKTGISPPSFWEENNVQPSIIGFTQTLPEDEDLAIAYNIEKKQMKIATSLSDDPKNNLCKKLAVFDQKEAEQKSAAWWLSYWQSVPKLKIPDPILQEMVTIGLYKQACVTPPHGIPCTLQGPFMEEYQLPSWSNDYHFNINVQMIYWPALASNRVEHFDPLWKMVNGWLPLFHKYGNTFFQNPDAILFPHAVDDGGHLIGGFWTGTIDHATSAWVAQLAWLSYRYSLEDSILRKIAWPLMKGSFEGYWSMLEKRNKADGSYEYYLPASVSPEWKGKRMDAWGENASFQLAAIHMITDILPKMAIILSEDIDDRWLEVKAHTPMYSSAILPETLEYPEFKSERIVLWDGMDLVESHRHHSHMAGIYPFKTFSPLSPEFRGISSNTLNHWLLMGNGQWACWSLPWTSSLLLQYGYVDAAVAYLHYLYRFGYNEGKTTTGDLSIKGLTYKNGGEWEKIPFGAKHGEIMQLDATFGALNAIFEIFVQNRNDTIKILPAIPKGWKEFSFSGILTEGAFLVSGVVKDGKLQKIKVLSKKGGEVVMQLPVQGYFVNRIKYEGNLVKRHCKPLEIIDIQL